MIIDPTLCIYHGNCADGFGAAWAVWKKYPDIEFHAGVYGEAPPSCLPETFDFDYFAATYFVNDKGERIYSLRSTGDFDVAEIAKKYGGGGHKNAAGFKVPNDEAVQRVA